MTTFRGAEIYVQGRTKQRLRWLAKALAPTIPGAPALTADQLADQFLNELIEERFPAIKEVETAYNEAEKRLQEALKPHQLEQSA